MFSRALGRPQQRVRDLTPPLLVIDPLRHPLTVSRVARPISGRRRITPTTFPGDHGGFLGGEYGQTGAPDAFAATRRGGEEYLLERGLFRRQSTGEVVQPAYLEFAFPYYWHYDVLRALDYFRRSGADPDPRMAAAVAVVRSRRQPDGRQPDGRQPDGRWLLDRIHPGRVHFHVEDAVGSPSRWNTLRALRVLDWWDKHHASFG